MKTGHITAVIATITLAGCGGDDTAGTPLADEPRAEAPSRCREAPRALVRALEEGLVAAEDGPRLRAGALTDAFIVRSEEPWPIGDRPLYFISAEIEGAGMEGAGQVGTWATDERKVGGMLLAADNYAKTFSSWGDAVGDGAPLDIAFTADGGPESRACVKDAP